MFYHDLSHRRQQHGTNSITNFNLIAIKTYMLCLIIDEHSKSNFYISTLFYFIIHINDLGQKGCKHNGASLSKRCGKKPLNDVLNNNLSLGKRTQFITIIHYYFIARHIA